MKSTINCYGVTVDNSTVTVSKRPIHAGCYGVSMIGIKSPMCVRAHVHAQLKSS